MLVPVCDMHMPELYFVLSLSLSLFLTPFIVQSFNPATHHPSLDFPMAYTAAAAVYPFFLTTTP